MNTQNTTTKYDNMNITNTPADYAKHLLLELIKKQGQQRHADALENLMAEIKAGYIAAADRDRYRKTLETIAELQLAPVTALKKMELELQTENGK